MKNLKFIFVLITAVAFNISSTSQNLTDVFSKPNTNYFEQFTYINTSKGTVNHNAEDWDLKYFKRRIAFWDSRINANGSYTSYLDTLKNYQQERKTTEIIWESLGPNYNNLHTDWQWVGRAQSIWVNPADTSEIYLGSDNGGLWKTENGGINWRLLTEEYAFGVNKIVVHPDNSDVMYIVTGDHANAFLSYGYYGQGVFKSTDKGETWLRTQQIAPEDMIYMSDIIFHPIDHNIMYALSGRTLYKSTDSGEHWNELSSLSLTNQDGGWFRDIAINPISPDNIVVSGSNEFHRSSDGGKTWTDDFHDLAGTVTTNVLVDYSPAGYLFALYYTKGKDFLKKSYDNGNKWSLGQYEGNLDANATVSFLKVVTDTIIWAGGTRPWKSVDRGESFVRMDDGYYKNVHPDIRDICFPVSSDLDVVYVATDGGVERNLLPFRDTWDILNGDLSLNECFTVAISEQDPEYMLTGTIDNGTYRRDSTGWKHVLAGDGALAVVSWADDSVNIASVKNAVKFSDDKFSLWWRSFHTTGAVWDSPVIQHPNEPKTYFAGKWAVSISENEGEDKDWVSFGTFGEGRVTAMNISKSNTDYFYCSKQKYDYSIPGYPSVISLWKTYNYGNNWDELTSYIKAVDTEIITDTRITEIEIHPNNHNKVWISLGNFSEGNKVLQTVNGGITWKNISYDLENIPVNNVKYDYDLDMLFAATNIGLFYLTDVSIFGSDQTWERYGNFPLVIASDIKINNNTRELIVATYGRGIWRADLLLLK